MRISCAKKCVEEPSCVAFNYPKEGNDLKYCFSKYWGQKSSRLGKTCGGPSDRGSYYTLMKREATCQYRAYECYHWTEADLKSDLPEEEKCENKGVGFVWSQGDESKAPGCGGCWCCQPSERRSCKSSGEKCLKDRSGIHNNCCSGKCTTKCKDSECNWYNNPFGRCA